MAEVAGGDLAGGQEPGSWQALMERAGEEGLLPRVSLLTGALESVPETVRDHLRALIRAHRVRCLLRVDELRRILALCAEHGISALSFKGPTLAVLCGGDSADRQFSDLDVLVRREDRHRAGRLLEHLGYEPEWPVAPGAGSPFRHSTAVAFTREGRADVDLHWGLSTPLVPFRLEMAGLWKRAQVVDLGGFAVRTLGYEDTLIHSCVHAAKDDWIWWSQIGDIAAITAAHPTLDLDLIRSVARATGTRRTIQTALLLARSLADAPLSGSMHAWARRDKRASLIAAEAEHHLRSGRASSQTIRARLHRTLRLRERFGDSIVALLGVAARVSEPRPHEEWPPWATPIRRPLRILRDLREDARPPLGGHSAR